MNSLIFLAALMVAMLILIAFYSHSKVSSRKIITTTSILAVVYICVSFFDLYITSFVGIVDVIWTLLRIPVAPFMLLVQFLNLIVAGNNSFVLLYQPTIFEFLFHIGIYTISISMLSWLVEKAFQRSKSTGIALLIGVCVVGVNAFFASAMLTMGGM